jgi:phage tail-like protein
VLLTPRSTPDEALPWLGSFVGLVLDERWARAPRPGGRTADARRAIVAEAAWLFRFRGTVPGLKRFVELYVGTEVVILEKFRLRGLGGTTLGERSVVGGGFRVGGALSGERGAESVERTADETLPAPRSPLAARPASAEAFAEHAHRFTVLIPAPLTEEQLDVVHHILNVHRPAHTIVDVCTVGAGMRAGRGLHVALSSIVGPTGGFQTLQLGATALGRDAVVGRPSGAITADASRVGRDARVR